MLQIMCLLVKLFTFLFYMLTHLQLPKIPPFSFLHYINIDIQ